MNPVIQELIKVQRGLEKEGQKIYAESLTMPNDEAIPELIKANTWTKAALFVGERIAELAEQENAQIK